MTVFLVSLKAGGVALNLTEASRVYLMDSWWNPAVSFRTLVGFHLWIVTFIQVEYRMHLQLIFAAQLILFGRGYGSYSPSWSTPACSSD